MIEALDESKDSGQLTADTNLPIVYTTNLDGGTVSYVGEKIQHIQVGKHPVSMVQAINSSGRFLYVGISVGKVVVIDTSTNTIVRTMAINGEINFNNNFNMAINEDRTRVYVSSFTKAKKEIDRVGYVTVMDALTHSVISTVKVGSNPVSMALTHHLGQDSGKLFVINYNDHSLSIIDTNTNTVISTLNLTKDLPNILAITRDDKYFIVGHQNSNKINIGEVATNSFIGTERRDDTARVRSIGVSLDNKYIYVALKNKNNEHRYENRGVNFAAYRLSDLACVHASYMDKRHIKYGDTVLIREFDNGDHTSTILLGGTSINHRLFKVIREGEGYNFIHALSIHHFSGYFDVTSDNQYIVTANPGNSTISYISVNDYKIIKTVQLISKPRIVIIDE